MHVQGCLPHMVLEIMCTVHWMSPTTVNPTRTVRALVGRRIKQQSARVHIRHRRQPRPLGRIRSRPRPIPNVQRNHQLRGIQPRTPTPVSARQGGYRGPVRHTSGLRHLSGLWHHTGHEVGSLKLIELG